MEALISGLVDWAVANPRPALVVAALVAVVVLANGYHPSTGWRDPVRIFTAEQKAIIHGRAGGRCEHKPLLWFRCRAQGTQADHVYPWSKGGPTTIENGQSMCGQCNRAKSARTPSRLYVWRLERRRRRYFPAGADTRVRVTVR